MSEGSYRAGEQSSGAPWKIGVWATVERAGGILQDSWVPTGQIPPTPLLELAGVWKQQQQQQQQINGMLDGAGKNGLAGKWNHQAGLPSASSSFPSHLTTSDPDLTLQQGVGKPGRGGHLMPRKGPSPVLCVLAVEKTEGVTQVPGTRRENLVLDSSLMGSGENPGGTEFSTSSFTK